MLRGLTVLTFLVVMANPAQALGLMRHLNWASTSENHEIAPDCSALPARSELVVSFVAPPDVHRLEQMQAEVDFRSGDSEVPSWWYFYPYSGGCRTDSLSVSTDLSLTDHPHPAAWQGQPHLFIGFTPFTYSDHRTAFLTIEITAAAGDTIGLEPFKEYDAFRIVFGNPPSGCGGCEIPTCFVLGRLAIQHDGKTDFTVSDGYSEYARWESGQLSCPFAVPTQPATWGRVKASYR